jgi:hypothetical protein
MQAFGQLSQGRSSGFRACSGRIALGLVRSHHVFSRLSLANCSKARPRWGPRACLVAAMYPILLGAGRHAQPQTPTVYVGFLERGGAKAAEWNQGEPSFPRVRVVFQRQMGQWRVIHGEARNQVELAESPHWYPSPIHWAVVSDGKRLGHVVSARPDRVDVYGSVGLQTVVSSDLAPTVTAPGQLEPRYADWPGTATFRPLVLTTGSFWQDPEKWQGFTPLGQPLGITFDSLRKTLATGVPVTFEETGDTATVSFACRQNSLRLVRAYRSKDGRELLSVELTGCTPPANTDIDYPITYLVLRDAGGITPLGSDLLLIDAGDYDGDGGSEVILGRSLHNHDSYILFSQRFGTRCEFSWGYH